MGHREGIDVVERRGENRKNSERQNDREVINPTAELLSILEFNLFLENKHSLLDVIGFNLHLPAPMNIIIHIIRNTLHLFLSKLFLYV